MKCKICGTENTDGLNYCGRCGSPLSPVSEMPMVPEGGVPPALQPVRKAGRNMNLIIICATVIVSLIIVAAVIYFVAADKQTKSSRAYEDDEDEIELVSHSASKSSTEPQSSIDVVANTDLSDSYVSTKWLQGLTKQELRVARNSIYARHGRYFQSKELQEIFGRCSWYSPYRSEIPTSELNKYEQANIKTIQAWE